MPTIKDETYELLRQLGLTTIVGNPGSTEEPFLADFPDDFEYVLALQETNVVAIADGLSQSLRKPVVANIHTGAGLGNAMGAVLTAYQNKTPLIITAGQQTRDMLLLEPLLTNIDAAQMPRPWVKWSYEPSRAEDVPAAFMRALAVAMQPPMGPVFLSLPLDDWNKEATFPAVVRSVATRQAGDPERVSKFANTINDSRNPVVLYGADLARSQAWEAGVLFAEKLGAPVWTTPFCERTPFPETHKQYAGVLPAAIGPLSSKLEGHDLVIVVGAPVFRYYPYVSGDYLPAEARLLQVTDDPDMAGKAAVGDSLLCDAKLFLDAVLPQIDKRPLKSSAPLRAAPEPASLEELPLTPPAVMSTLASLMPQDYVLVEECPSMVAEMQNRLRIDKPDCFYTFASGGLGWGLPAAVGLALGERESGRNRPVVCLMGDGSFQYSIQGLYTSAQQNTHLIYVVLQNHEYGILKEFADLEHTPNVPGLDLPGIDIASLARGYGPKTTAVSNTGELEAAFRQALDYKGASVIVVEMSTKLGSLLG
ncbi:benzoylformate decarboxylase [Martelella lutilitoris]|uniref:Benzoylformate decarboxylase n=1 Tax=Martelella lutilitoris TaxID=2583532 RepID=A0A5C4JN20_9HYPH|nr:benzoylformate decarboxylase [Martelella lutilitoris]TNB46707.1 benzoylformate decarboxylase [Martelella lutilitoris]